MDELTACEVLTACEACRSRGKTWPGDDPKCSFPNGRPFTSSGLSCATAGLIRDLVAAVSVGTDMKYATICVGDVEGADGALALWVAWYKSRGRTDAMWLLFHDRPPRPPTEGECLAIWRHLGD